MQKPEWYVYIYNLNHRKIETYNIFNHGTFFKYYIKALEESATKEEFADKIQSELRYYFWSKCEWEIEIVDWMGHQKNGLKTDVFKQITLNFDVFVDYVWGFKGNVWNIKI